MLLFIEESGIGTHLKNAEVKIYYDALLLIMIHYCDTRYITTDDKTQYPLLFSFI